VRNDLHLGNAYLYHLTSYFKRNSKIVEALDIPWAVLLSQDSFYKSLVGDDLIKAENAAYNFDHPGNSIVILLN
jgi:uridine kinase